jgi:hypothetical protein
MARDLKFLVKDLKDVTIRAVRTTCVQIMNGLVEAGPGYSGEFSSAWYAVPKGDSPGGPRKASGLYKYDLRNVPATKFQTAGIWYTIVNGAPHADVAMDLTPYVYDPNSFDGKAVKDQTEGYRPANATRGQLVGTKGPNTSTAPKDWWPTYNAGGALNKDLAKGFRTGLKAPPSFGTAQGFG